MSFNEMLKMEEGASFSINHFQDGHLKYIHLQKTKYRGKEQFNNQLLSINQFLVTMTINWEENILQ